jgi:hypothetical protein
MTMDNFITTVVWMYPVALMLGFSLYVITGNNDK